jgi:nanoRNase/pAp phosphatase (c-di-AMP/oligoRNAs hydrolase)
MQSHDANGSTDASTQQPGQRLELLGSAVRNASQVLILPHNNPDPDAIASAVALRYLLAQQFGIASQVLYKGVIGRAENRALIRYLGRPLSRLVSAEQLGTSALMIVDTQPTFGNSAVDQSIPIEGVIDHHPPDASRVVVAPFIDIRPDVGATATLLTEYLQTAGLTPTRQLATALFYGIKTDTLGLMRGVSEADIAAYLYLQPHVDVSALIEIEHAQVPVDYFRQLNQTVRAARVYQHIVIAQLGAMAYPDLVGEMADLLLRLDGMRWSFCMGQHNDALILSVRTRDRQGGAGRLARTVIGEEGSAGGHGMLAGGHIKLDGQEPAVLERELERRILQALDISELDGTPLLGAQSQELRRSLGISGAHNTAKSAKQ